MLPPVKLVLRDENLITPNCREAIDATVAFTLRRARSLRRSASQWRRGVRLSAVLHYGDEGGLSAWGAQHGALGMGRRLDGDTTLANSTIDRDSFVDADKHSIPLIHNQNAGPV